MGVVMGAPEHTILFSYHPGAISPVTVLIPLHNYAGFVREALNSLLNQTFPHLALVVVDDGSQDLSRETVCEWVRQNCARFQEVWVIAHHQNHGGSAARNTGFHYNRSPFIFLLDADNLLLPKCIARCVEVLERTAAAFAYPIIAKFGNEIGLVSNELWNLERLLVYNYIDAMALIRKDVWQEVGGFAEDLPFLEDYDFWLRLATKGRRGVQVPEILAKYRVHGSSMTERTKPQLAERRQELRKRHAHFPWPST